MTVQAMSMWEFPIVSAVQYFILHTGTRFCVQGLEYKYFILHTGTRFCVQGICNLVRLEAMPK